MNAETGKILDQAAKRGAQAKLPYAGAVSLQEAHQLHSSGAARIVDVRTEPEWLYVGRIPGSDHIEWRVYGAQQPNPDFLARLESTVKKDEVVLFLCRSAQRSHSAATIAAKAGFMHAYNILEGFEGNLDADNHRGTTGGWRKAGLPWEQS